MAKKARTKSKVSPKAKMAAKVVSGAAKRTERAVKKAAKVAKHIAKTARAMRPSNKVEVDIVTKSLHEAPQHHHFVLHDGRHMRSIYELIDELETMSEETFKFHVNEAKNDFSVWVGDVFEEKHLAEEIQRVHDRMAMQRALLKHLVREMRRAALKK